MSKHFLRNCIYAWRTWTHIPELKIVRRSYIKGVETEVLPKACINDAVQTKEKAKKRRRGLGDWAIELARSTEILTMDEWKSVRSDVPVAWDVFESQVMFACCQVRNLGLARSLLGFIERESRSPSLVALSKYVRLCGECEEEEVDEVRLLEILNQILHKWPVLDGSTAEDVVHGLCRTHRWKESFRHLEVVRATCGRPNRSTLVAVASAAFRDDECDVGWKVMEELSSNNTNLLADGPLLIWLKKCSSAPLDDRASMITQMFHYLRTNEMFVSREVAEQIKFFFESKLDEHWVGTFTTVSFGGVCQSCKSSLESIALDDDEFCRLRDSFLQKVIQGNDVFLKSTPAEVQRFQNFVNNTAPYTLVLDGLNVAYCMRHKNVSQSQLAKQLLGTVQHFNSKKSKSRILVLGRQHMQRWPRNILDTIRREALVFFTDNLSKDDPFLLYAALFSGQGTLFVSKDMMRDHLFCLQESGLAASFRRWQRGHQLQLLGFAPNGQVLYKPPLSYNLVVQKTQDHWHVPYIEKDRYLPGCTPDTWLCLSKIASSRPPKVLVPSLSKS